MAEPSRRKTRSIMSAGLDQLDFQELQKARVGVGVGGQVVQQKCRVNGCNVGFRELLLDGLHQNEAHDQCHQGQGRGEDAPQVQTFVAGTRKRTIGLKGCAVTHQTHGGGTRLKGPDTRNPQALADVVAHVLGGQVQLLCEIVAPKVHVCSVGGGGFHSFMPWSDKVLFSAKMAREQWVLTLPSEHPITAAVSDTSSSSQ